MTWSLSSYGCCLMACLIASNLPAELFTRNLHCCWLVHMAQETKQYLGNCGTAHVKQPLAAGLRTAYRRELHTFRRPQQLAQQLCDSVWCRLPGIQAAIKCTTSLMCMREGKHAPFGARSSCCEGCAGVVGADCATSCLPAPPWASRALLPGIACMQNSHHKSRPVFMHSDHQDLQSTLRPCRLLSKHSTMGQGLSEPLHLHF